MRPSVLHFEWKSFLTSTVNDPPVSNPPEAYLWSGLVTPLDGVKPVLIFRVWYQGNRGLVGFVGDRSTGPASVLSAALADIMRAGEWADKAGVILTWRGAWSAEWDEVQP